LLEKSAAAASGWPGRSGRLAELFAVLLDKPIAPVPVPNYGSEKHQKKYGTICALMRLRGHA
jgi:hypothetical protein